MTGVDSYDDAPRRPHRRVRPRPVPLPEVDPRRLPPDHPALGPFEAAGLVRRVRQITRIGQRELAWRARMSHGTVGRIETGELAPSLAVLQRLLAVAGLHLVVVTEDGTVVPALPDYDQWSGATPLGRRLYAHHRWDRWARSQNPDPLASPDVAAAKPDWTPPERVTGEGWAP